MSLTNITTERCDAAVVDDIHFFVNTGGYIGALIEVFHRDELKFEKIPNTAEYLKRDIRIGDRLVVDRRGNPTRRVDLGYRDSGREVTTLPEYCPKCSTLLVLEFERKPQLKCNQCGKGSAMITEVTGDIFSDGGEDVVICIPVNTCGTAGKGPALTMRLEYPETYKQYKKACKRGRIATGDLTVVHERGKRLALLPVRYEWRNTEDLDLIEISLIRLKKYLTDNGIKVCHLPRLGCGATTGQLDYHTTVRPIIQKVFAGSKIRVVVYEQGT